MTMMYFILPAHHAQLPCPCLWKPQAWVTNNRAEIKPAAWLNFSSLPLGQKWFLPVRKRSTESIRLLLLQHLLPFLLSRLSPGQRVPRPQEGWRQKDGSVKEMQLSPNLRAIAASYAGSSAPSGEWAGCCWWLVEAHATGEAWCYHTQLSFSQLDSAFFSSQHSHVNQVKAHSQSPSSDLAARTP